MYKCRGKWNTHCYLHHKIITDLRLRDNSIWELLARKCWSTFPSSHKHRSFEIKRFISYKSKKGTYEFHSSSSVVYQNTNDYRQFHSFRPRKYQTQNLSPFQIPPPLFHITTAPSGSGSSLYRDLTITPSHTTLGRTPLDESSPRRRDLTWQHTTLSKIRYPCPGRIRNGIPSKRAATDPRLRPRGQYDRHQTLLFVILN